jgi:hypothetical protein
VPTEFQNFWTIIKRAIAKMAIELKELQYAIISRLERFSSFLEIEDNKTKIEEICKRMFVDIGL